jgi:hypothetical protein
MIASYVPKERVTRRRKIDSSLVSPLLNARGNAIFAQACWFHVMPWPPAMFGFMLLPNNSQEKQSNKSNKCIKPMLGLSSAPTFKLASMVYKS